MTKERGSFAFPQAPTSSDHAICWQIDPKGHKAEHSMRIYTSSNTKIWPLYIRGVDLAYKMDDQFIIPPKIHMHIINKYESTNH